MLNVEIRFNTTIAKYNMFHQAAVALLQEIRSLSPDMIYHRCERLTAMHQELMENKEQLFSLMEFVGPGILETSYIGDFQRSLDKSIAACEALYREILLYRENLNAQVREDAHEVDIFSLIPPGTTIQ
ncbi:MAG: hypothetical protein F9K32_16400 [Desulfobulbaceae bacterium]|nr:MAG: hypothetical protein F9K32_16400 [Desulfobulbaceae bacterium]